MKLLKLRLDTKPFEEHWPASVEARMFKEGRKDITQPTLLAGHVGVIYFAFSDHFQVTVVYAKQR